MTIAIAGVVLALSFGQAQPPASAPAPAATGRVSGRVTAEGTNAPVAGARVVLFPAAPRMMGPFGPPGEGFTDQDGRFEFDGLAPGDYRLDVQKTGFVGFPGMRGRPYTIQIAAGQTTSNVAVQLQKGGAIAGRLLDASGEPMTDAGVMALRRMSLGGTAQRYMPAPGATQQTNDLGEFRLPGLAPGEYIVAATPRRQMPFGGPGVAPPPANTARTTVTTTYYPGTIDQAAAHPITVSAGQTVENVGFTMQSVPAFRISGVVVDDSGNAIAGAMVMLSTDPRTAMMGPAAGTRTQDDGRFVIASVPSGSYKLSATIPVSISSGSVGAGGGGSIVTWTSGGVTGGVVSGTTRVMGPGSMPQPTDVVVTDADVVGVRVVVRK